MKLPLSLLAASAALLSAQAHAAPGRCLDVRLSAPASVVRGDVDVTVQVAVTNTCRQPVQALSWQLPADDMEEPLFAITRDGQRVAYQGALVKRVKPEAADHVKIAPGQTLNYSVELTGSYDLSQNGRYAIQYAARGHRSSAAEPMGSDAMYLWLEGRTAKLSATALPSAITPAAASISYTGRCTASQITQLQSAVTAATNYSSSSASYLSGISLGTARYTTWFGTYSSANRTTALDHFQKAAAAFQGQALTLDCSCKKKGTYAYVYPNQPYKIYVCGAFWSAPMTGTDSKGGTLVHEMMHFTVIAGTDDWAYGQTNAKALAISDPIKALNNSDNHEYFAENTPFQN